MLEFLSLGSIAFAVGLVGSSIAAVFDLKTTEIPDKIPYSMVAVALILYGAQSIVEWSYVPLLNSVSVGILLFGFGFVLYHFGQWGGGDAKLLSAIGFLLPNYSVFSSLEALYPQANLLFPFPLSYLFNVFFVGAIYMIVYALALAAINRKIFTELKREVKASSNMIAFFSAALFVAFLFINGFFAKNFNMYSIIEPSLIMVNSLISLALTVGLFLVWRFVRAVENVAFKKRIPVSKLKVGDVLMSSKLWEGLTEKELKRIKGSKKKHVWIKEGVRFAPAFPIALLFTFYFGDAVMFLFRFLG